jgi:adenylate cyclase
LLMLQENATVRFERVRVLENLSSYLPKEVAQEIAFTLPNSSVSAQRRSATLLVADLRNFARFTEACPAEESATLLHYFVVKASGIIESHGGQLHELKGDGIIALWSEEKENAAESALNAAQALQEVITPLLEQYSLKGLEPLALGIGIEHGPVLIGSIGPANRRIHTLLGDTVTIALRIQGLTVDLAQPILLGACVARFLPDAGLISQGSFLLDGLMSPHTLFAAPYQTTYKSKKSLASISKPKLRVFSGGNRS